MPERHAPRLLLCTSGGLFGARVMQQLLASAAVELVGIVHSTRVMHPQRGSLHGIVQLLRRTGLRYTLYLGAATGGAELLGRWRGLPAVDAAALELGLPLLATSDLNDDAGQAFIAGLRPDLVLSAFFNQRIGTAVCDLPALGAVNIHPSLLPEFKGVDPVFQARLRKAQRLGVSLHRITPAFDAGPVLRQAVVEVEPAASLLGATARLFDRGVALLLDALPALQQGEPGVAQADGGRYDSWPTADQVRAFRHSGQRLLRLDDLRLLARA